MLQVKMQLSFSRFAPFYRKKDKLGGGTLMKKLNVPPILQLPAQRD